MRSALFEATGGPAGMLRGSSFSCERARRDAHRARRAAGLPSPGCASGAGYAARMFKIYDERSLAARLRMRRFYVLMIFAAGAASGSWLSESGGWPVANAQPMVTAQAVDCEGRPAQRATLRLACRLSN